MNLIILLSSVLGVGATGGQPVEYDGGVLTPERAQGFEYDGRSLTRERTQDSEPETVKERLDRWVRGIRIAMTPRYYSHSSPHYSYGPRHSYGYARPYGYGHYSYGYTRPYAYHHYSSRPYGHYRHSYHRYSYGRHHGYGTYRHSYSRGRH